VEKPRCFWKVILAVLAALLLREVFAMPHGQRDWANVGATEVVHGLSDMAELAVRLGSPDAHNREGNVLMIEDFENGLGAWNEATSGPGAEIKISTEAWRTRGYSCKLISGSSSGRQAFIFRRVPYPVLGRYGLELTFFPGSNIWLFGMRLSRHDGETEHQFFVLYNNDDHELLTQGSGGSSTAFASDVDLEVGYHGNHTMKMVVDFDTDMFVRFILNETEYDISDREPFLWGSTDKPHLDVVVIVYSNEGYNADCYVDDIILTQNEPP
jgi:type II secretory pathway pseudopilin PulG